MPKLAAWMVNAPLWQRYHLTAEKAVSNFEAGMSRAEWLIVAEFDRQAIGFAWAIPKGAFGRSPYLRLIGVHPDHAEPRLLDGVDAAAAVQLLPTS